MTDETPPLTGHDLIADYLTRLDGSPGVYRMLDRESRVLYVGKAKNLKNVSPVMPDLRDIRPASAA